MKHTVVLALVSALGSAVGQMDGPRKPLTVTFNGGIGFEIHTESSASRAPLSTFGAVNVGAGNVSRRAVMDKSGRTIFSYDIEALKHGENAVVLRFKPAPDEGPKTLRSMKQSPPLLAGDTVEVDILQNAGTGERIYDVVRVTDQRSRSSNAPPDLFSLLQPAVLINGKIAREQANFWMTGGGLMVRVPGRGDYYMNLGPSSKHPFRPLGWVDRNTLRFQAGTDLIEIVAKGNVLKRADFRTIWIYHDPDSISASKAVEAVDFTCGDDGDQLVALLKPSK